MKTVSRSLAAALALSLFCGCGKDDSTASVAAASVAAAPKMPDGAVAGIAGYACDKGKIGESRAKVDETLAALKEAEPKLAEFLTASGLDRAKPRWYAFSMVGLPKFDKDDGPETVPALALALSFDHNLAKIVKAAKAVAEGEDFELELKKTSISGVDCWILRNDAKKMKKVGLEPCCASLDGKILLAASSVSSMERQIGLYRDGKGESGKLPSSMFATSDLFHLAIPDAGTHISRIADDAEADLSPVDQIIPDGEAMLRNMGTVELVVGSADGNSVDVRLSAQMASEEHAKSICALVNGSLVPLQAQLKKLEESDDGDDVKVKVGVPVLKTVEATREGASLTISARIEPDVLDYIIKHADEFGGNCL